MEYTYQTGGIRFQFGRPPTDAEKAVLDDALKGLAAHASVALTDEQIAAIALMDLQAATGLSGYAATGKDLD